MQLCDRDIFRAISEGELVLAGTTEGFPFNAEKQVQPASIDLRLGNRIVKFKKTTEYIDINDIKETSDIEKYLDVQFLSENDKIEIGPNEIVFGQIYELMDVGNNFSARVVGRSRVARLGLSVHCTGSFINPGFCGAMPLQIYNHNKFPIIIYPYIPICQLILYKTTGPPVVDYQKRSHLLANPYYGEENASSSILTRDEYQNDSMMSRKMGRLIQDHLDQFKKDKNGKGDIYVNADTLIYQNMPHGSHIMRDQYNAQQVGTLGASSGKKAKITQSMNITLSDNDVKSLMLELDKIIKELRRSKEGNEEDAIAIGKLLEAKQEIQNGNQSKAITILKNIGSKVAGIVKTIGCAVAASVISAQIGV